MNFHDYRAAAHAVACPKRPHGCGAQAGDPCVNVQTGHALEARPAHEARLWNAEALSVTPWPYPYIREPADARPKARWPA